MKNNKGRIENGSIVAIVIIVGVIALLAVYSFYNSEKKIKVDNSYYKFDKDIGSMREIENPTMEGDVLLLPDKIDGYFVRELNLYNLDEAIHRITIPEHVQEVSGVHEIDEFIVDENNRFLTAYNGSLYNKELDTLYYLVGKSGDVIEFPKTLRNISSVGINTENMILKFNCPVDLIQTNTWNSMEELISNAKDVIFSEDETNYYKEDGIIYKNNGKDLVSYKREVPCNEYIVSGDVERIGKFAFSNCNINKIIIGNSVKYIEEYAFCYNFYLKTIDINDDIKEIKEGTFNYCSHLKQVKFPKNLKYIDKMAFAGTAVEILELPEGLIEIDERAFWYCENLKSVYFPNSLKVIGKEAFSAGWGQNSLKNVTISENTFLEGENIFDSETKVNKKQTGA